MAHFLFEAKKSKKKKKAKKKSKKRSYYYGTNFMGFPWMGRAAMYPPMAPPPGPPGPPPGMGGMDGGFAGGDCGGCCGIGESEIYLPSDLDEQTINIYQYDENGSKVGKRTDFFNPVRFKKALEDGIVRFIYTKVNGEKREAYGTTNLEILRNNDVKDLRDKNKPRNTNNIRYYDLQKHGWRSFKPESLKSIYEKVTVKAI